MQENSGMKTGGSARWRRRGVDCALAAALLAVLLVGTSRFVASERIVYWSDYAGYQEIAHGILVQLRDSPRAALVALVHSMGSEYNALFSIPLLPFLLLFGESRVVFELALAVVYLLPFVLVLGAIAAKLVPHRPRGVFWSTVCLTLLTPAAWLPTLRGYPDTGAAALIGLAIWLYLHDTRLRRWWPGVSIGVLLVGALLFRRHFAYGSVACFAAMTLHTMARVALDWRRPSAALRELGIAAVRLGVVAASGAAVLALFGRAFVYRTLTTDYNALYAAYLEPPSRVLAAFAGFYGWGVVALAMLGLATGLLHRGVRRDALAFVALFGALSVAQWLVAVRQPGEHYTLHFTPLIVLGLALLVWAARAAGAGWFRRAFLPAFSCYVVLNLVIALMPPGEAGGSRIRALFAGGAHPLTRPDYDEVARLVAYLRSVTTPRDAIFVAASSEVLGSSLLSNAERQGYGWEDTRLRVLYTPQIDSRDFYPLEALLQAKIVVVVDPFQHHLDADQQRVVGVVYDLFMERGLIAQDFEPLPATFRLQEGATAHIYERARPTSTETAIQTLDWMERAIRVRPGGQLDWLVLSQPASGPADGAIVEQLRDGRYDLTARPLGGPAPGAATFLYLGSLPERSALSGTIHFEDSRCPGVDLRLAVSDGRGRATEIAAEGRRPGDAATFTAALPQTGAAFLLLSVSGLGGARLDEGCALTLQHLEIKTR